MSMAPVLFLCLQPGVAVFDLTEETQGVSAVAVNLWSWLCPGCHTYLQRPNTVEFAREKRENRRNEPGAEEGESDGEQSARKE